MDDPIDEWQRLVDNLPDADVPIIACVLRGLFDWMARDDTDQDEPRLLRVAHVIAHIDGALLVWADEQQLNKN